MTNQNIFTATNCGNCSFSGNCPGQRGLMSEMERRDCVPAFMALSAREVKAISKSDDSEKKGKKKRNRSKSKKRA